MQEPSENGRMCGNNKPETRERPFCRGTFHEMVVVAVVVHEKEKANESTGRQIESQRRQERGKKRAMFGFQKEKDGGTSQ